nr:hypothetical protein [Tanacetum cinerariifolium]
MISFVVAVHGMTREQERITVTYIVKRITGSFRDCRLCLLTKVCVVGVLRSWSAPASKTQYKRTSSSQLTRSLWFAATDLCSKEVEMVVLEDSFV